MKMKSLKIIYLTFRLDAQVTVVTGRNHFNAAEEPDVLAALKGMLQLQ